MDPIALMAYIIRCNDAATRKDATRDLKDWYAMGGFHPTVKEVLESIGQTCFGEAPDKDDSYFNQHKAKWAKAAKRLGATH